MRWYRRIKRTSSRPKELEKRVFFANSTCLRPENEEEADKTREPSDPRLILVCSVICFFRQSLSSSISFIACFVFTPLLSSQHLLVPLDMKRDESSSLIPEEEEEEEEGHF